MHRRNTSHGCSVWCLGWQVYSTMAGSFRTVKPISPILGWEFIQASKPRQHWSTLQNLKAYPTFLRNSQTLHGCTSNASDWVNSWWIILPPQTLTFIVPSYFVFPMHPSLLHGRGYPCLIPPPPPPTKSLRKSFKATSQLLQINAVTSFGEMNTATAEKSQETINYTRL